jgi:hypothetical protein
MASEELNQNFVRRVTQKDDPVISNQTIGLFSFTPSTGSTPDKYGVYGVAKLRGNYATEEDAQIAADRIIRDVDSFNNIYHVRVGQSFPLSTENKFTQSFDEVDVKVDRIEREREIIQRKKEAEDIKIIKSREQKLLKENQEILENKYEQDPLDVYIMLKVKRAQLLWTYKETEKKLKNEVRPAFYRTVEDIKEMDLKYPEFADQYYQRYMDARSENGIQDPKSHESFLKYLMEDELIS